MILQNGTWGIDSASLKILDVIYHETDGASPVVISFPTPSNPFVVESSQDFSSWIEVSPISGSSVGFITSVSLPTLGSSGYYRVRQLLDVGQDETTVSDGEFIKNPDIGHFVHQFNIPESSGVEIAPADSGHTILSAGSGNLSGLRYPNQIAAKVSNGLLSLDGGGNHYFVPRYDGAGSGLGFAPRYIGAEIVFTQGVGSANSFAVFLVAEIDSHPTVPMIHFTISNEGWNCEEWQRDAQGDLDIVSRGSVLYATPWPLDGTPQTVMIELAPERDVIVVYVTGQQPIEVPFAGLSSLNTPFVSYQLSESRPAAGQPEPFRKTAFETIFAYDKQDLESSNGLAASKTILAIEESRSIGATIPAPIPVKTRDFATRQNGSVIADDVTRVTSSITQAGWGDSFFTIFLPDPADVETGHEIEFSDIVGGMDTSNPNSRFINLSISGGGTWNNPQYGGGERFIGESQFVARVVSSTQWEIVTRTN